MSVVHFLPVEVKRIDEKRSLLYRYERLLEKLVTREMVENKTVAIKLHLGGRYGYTHVHPAFVTRVVNRVKDLGGKPFITDHRRDNRLAGVIPEALGCPIYHATGLKDKYAYPVRTGFTAMPSVDVAGYLRDADALININHAKGHGTCGFGAAIKNIGMGAVTGHYRGVIHRLMDKAFKWHATKCIHCKKCVTTCEHDAISFSDKGNLEQNAHHCTLCLHCMTVCPTGAITISDKGWPEFQKGLAAAAKAVLSGFDKKSVLHINVALNITPICDCWGLSVASFRPDVGIFASDDIVAVDKATIDALDCKEPLPNTIPEEVTLRPGNGHIFQRLWGKDPYLQVTEAARMRMGSLKYALKTVP